MLSEIYKRATEEELARLKKRRSELTSQIDRDIKKLEDILGASTTDQEHVTQVSFRIDAGLGFVASIEKILSGRPQGLKAFEVYEELLHSGYKVSGKTSLKDRVAGELSRLRRNGKLQLTDEGAYRLAN